MERIPAPLVREGRRKESPPVASPPGTAVADAAEEEPPKTELTEADGRVPIRS